MPAAGTGSPVSASTFIAFTEPFWGMLAYSTTSGSSQSVVVDTVKGTSAWPSR